jgi:AcrR family transcriptional regulator
VPGPVADRVVGRGVVYGDPDRTKRLILEAGLKEFAEHGFGGARTDRIAADAQVNKQALYYHFGNKNDLFTAVLEHAYRRFRDGYAHVGPMGLPPEEQFRALLNNLFDLIAANRDIFAILLDENRMRGKHLPNAQVRDTANHRAHLGRREGAGPVPCGGRSSTSLDVDTCAVHLQLYTLVHDKQHPGLGHFQATEAGRAQGSCDSFRHVRDHQPGQP